MGKREVTLDDLLVAPVAGNTRAEFARGRYLMDLAGQMAGRCLDAGKIASKLGTQNDLVQQIALVLLTIMSGEKKFDPVRGISFEGFVLNEVRILATRNCLVFDSLDGADVDVSDLVASSGHEAPVDTFGELALIETLSARDRIFAKCSPAGLAKLVGQTDRNIRLERAKIAKRVQEGLR